jgi:hypothetical protein
VFLLSKPVDGNHLGWVQCNYRGSFPLRTDFYLWRSRSWFILISHQLSHQRIFCSSHFCRMQPRMSASMQFAIPYLRLSTV